MFGVVEYLNSILVYGNVSYSHFIGTLRMQCGVQYITVVCYRYTLYININILYYRMYTGIPVLYVFMYSSLTCLKYIKPKTLEQIHIVGVLTYCVKSTTISLSLDHTYPNKIQ